LPSATSSPVVGQYSRSGRLAGRSPPDSARLCSNPGRLGVAELLFEHKYADAFAHLSAAALRGDARGEAWLGEMHERGLAALPKSPDKAEAYYKRSISAKIAPSPAGFNNLGLLVETGWDEQHKPDPLRALAMFRQGASQCIEPNYDPSSCYAPALFNYARLQAFRPGSTAQDATKSLELLERAARLDFVPALVAVGYLAEKGIASDCDPGRAVRTYASAAERGDGYGLAMLGRAHELGIGGTKVNLTQAAKEYRQSAAEENPYGQAYLGRLYMRPAGVRGVIERDLTEAKRLLELSAAKLNPAGQFGLAQLLQEQKPLNETDAARARDLLNRAADAGDEDALTALGRPSRFRSSCH